MQMLKALSCFVVEYVGPDVFLYAERTVCHRLQEHSFRSQEDAPCMYLQELRNFGVLVSWVKKNIHKLKFHMIVPISVS